MMAYTRASRPCKASISHLYHAHRHNTPHPYCVCYTDLPALSSSRGHRESSSQCRMGTTAGPCLWLEQRRPDSDVHAQPGETWAEVLLKWRPCHTQVVGQARMLKAQSRHCTPGWRKLTRTRGMRTGCREDA